MVKKCHCIIKHANNPKERTLARKILDNARRAGDSVGIMVSMTALTGRCPAKLRVCK